MIFFTIVGIMTILSFIIYLINNWNKDNNKQYLQSKPSNKEMAKRHHEAAKHFFNERKYLLAFHFENEAKKLEPNNEQYSASTGAYLAMLETGIALGTIDMKEQEKMFDEVFKKANALMNKINN